MASFLIAVLTMGLAVFLVAQLLPGIKVRNFPTALLVALVFGILNALLKKLLIFLTLPFVVLTLGLFIVVINAFLLWITSRLIKGFEVAGIGPLLLGTLLISLIDLIFHWMIF
ncbi:MAG TPA: phage holin family protein [Acidobacteriota bacterium]|nr:phage holin family protein [Acidobacteriota bacterium]